MRLVFFTVILAMLCSLASPLFAAEQAKKRTTTHAAQAKHSRSKAKRTRLTKTQTRGKKKNLVRKKRRSKKPALPGINLPASILGKKQLNDIINKIVAYESDSADVAVYVKSMRGQNTLYARKVNRSFTPASTMKILTAEAALLYLGPDYRFSTQILTDAPTVKNGMLKGNLYVVLSGDPSLTYEELLDLMMTLKSQHIRSVQGNVYIDDTAYDKRFYGPGWEGEDKEYCYAAPISASIINHNCLPFQVSPSAVSGKKAKIVKSPKYFYPTIKNTVVTKARKTRSCSISLTKEPGSIISINGCMPKGRNAWGVSYVVTDVPEYNRALFKSLLSRVGIKVYGKLTFGSAPDDLEYIGTHSSEPLEELIRTMLKKSDNVIAGALFKKLGQLYSRQPGSWENGSLAVSKILSRRTGMGLSGLRILDGSGLSPDNLATPAQMMKVLNFAWHHASISEEFITALPIAGVDGTLKYRMKHIARKVRAKTGTISGVTSLAGYAESAEREPLAFVIMVNGTKHMRWRYKVMEDQIVTALTRYRQS